MGCSNSRRVVGEDPPLIQTTPIPENPSPEPEPHHKPDPPLQAVWTPIAPEDGHAMLVEFCHENANLITRNVNHSDSDRSYAVEDGTQYYYSDVVE
jgi:hypothetical protein